MIEFERAQSRTPQSVSALVAEIKGVIEPRFRQVWVQGELSGVKHHTSGHWYFILKDDNAQLRGVLFRRDAERLIAPLQDGQQVAIRGRLGVFERDGQTQLYASTVEWVGQGAALVALEALKRALYAEGLFSRPKRTWPRIPRCVAVITAETGAARRDIEAVTARRCPGVRLALIPAVVQGDQAVASLVAALAHVDPAQHDVVILGRGGGATEDLQAFNAEAVVRAVAACPVPVIAAVGHEIDTTLVDLAADRRAPTPSAAAEMAVPDVHALRTQHMQLQARWATAWSGYVGTRRERWQRAATRPWMTDPRHLWDAQRQRWERLAERWDRAWMAYLERLRHARDLVAVRWAAVDPLAVLDRGYAYVTDPQGRVVTARDAAPLIAVHWADGTITYRKEGAGHE